MLHFGMPNKASSRAYKTAWFGKAAKKARIGDQALMAAILEVIQGRADDLGGGVFKKRLNDNMHRSIRIGKGWSPLGVRIPLCQEGPRQYRRRRARFFQEACAGLRSHDGSRSGIRIGSR